MASVSTPSVPMASVAPPQVRPPSSGFFRLRSSADPTHETSESVAESALPSSRSILEHGWWSVLAWAGGLLLGAGSLSDNSFLTHVATGRLIRSTGVPHEDVFSFASAGKPIVVQSWLASWMYAALDSVGGGNAIRLLVAAVCGALLLTLWRLSAPAGGLLPRVGLVSMAGMVGLLWWNERPQILGFLAFALIALVLQDRRNPAWLVPLFAFWVNVHGSFPLGVAFVGAMLVVAAVEQRRSGGPFVERRALLVLSATVAGLLVGALVSPYGFEMLTFPVELLGRSQSLAFITEWRPLAFTSNGTINTNSVVFAAESVAICALLVWRRSWLRLAVAVVFVAMAFWAVRNVAIAALVLIPLSAPSLAGLGTPDPTVTPPRLRRLAFGGLAAALVAAFIVASPGYDLDAYPTRAVDWMEAHGMVGRSTDNADVLTHDYDGNYLEWRYGTRAKPWLDDRAELHAYEVARDYVLLLSDLGDSDEILARNPHDVVLWETKSALGEYLRTDPDYRIVYSDDQAIVACRLGSTFC